MSSRRKLISKFPTIVLDSSSSGYLPTTTYLLTYVPTLPTLPTFPTFPTFPTYLPVWPVAYLINMLWL